MVRILFGLIPARSSSGNKPGRSLNRAPVIASREADRPRQISPNAMITNVLLCEAWSTSCCPHHVTDSGKSCNERFLIGFPASNPCSRIVKRSGRS